MTCSLNRNMLEIGSLHMHCDVCYYVLNVVKIHDITLNKW